VCGLVIAVLAGGLLALAWPGVSRGVSESAASSDQEGLAMPRGAAGQLASAIAGSLAAIDARLDELVKNEQMIALFGDGDKVALATQAERLAGEIPPALKVRLFLPGDYDLEPQARRPPLGFASLDLLRQAETGDALILWGSTPNGAGMGPR